MKIWLRRLGYLTFVIIWLAIMLFPAFAFTLSRQEQIELGRNPRNHVRFFLVLEESAEGMAVEWVRPLLTERNCSKTNVVYLFWEGGADNPNSSFCQCYDPQTEQPLPVNGLRCQP
jgi:hypothetical protein